MEGLEIQYATYVLDTSARYASLVANARRNKYDFACTIIAHDGQIGPDVEPVPPAGPGGVSQPLSAVSSAAQRGPGALGSLSACLGGDPLCRCGDRLPALLGQSHPHPREIGSDGALPVDPAGASDGAPDALSRPAQPWTGAWPGLQSLYPAAGRGLALAYPGHHQKPIGRGAGPGAH